MKTKVITVMISLALTTVCFGQEKTPPTAIDCTFTNIDVVKLRLPGYSNTKVAPEDMAWLKPGADPYIPPGQLGRTEGFVVLGRGTGHVTPGTDLRKLCIALARVASDHGANAINYQVLNHGTQLRVQFLRVEDALLHKPRRRQNPLGEVAR